MCQQTAEEVKSEGSSAASPTPGSTSECFQVHTNNNASPQSRISVPGAMLVPVLTANVFAMNERKAIGKKYIHVLIKTFNRNMIISCVWTEKGKSILEFRRIRAVADIQGKA